MHHKFISRTFAAFGIAGALVAGLATSAVGAVPGPPTVTTVHRSDGGGDHGGGDGGGGVSDSQIKPYVVCVWSAGSGQYVTVFGYVSTKAGTIAVGDHNFFGPGAKSVGQPTTFTLGTNKNAVVVRHSGSLTWHLGSTNASSPERATTCKDNPMPMGGAPISSVLWIGTGVSIVGLLSFIRRRNSPASIV